MVRRDAEIYAASADSSQLLLLLLLAPLLLLLPPPLLIPDTGPGPHYGPVKRQCIRSSGFDSSLLKRP